MNWAAYFAPMYSQSSSLPTWFYSTFWRLWTSCGLWIGTCSTHVHSKNDSLNNLQPLLERRGASVLREPDWEAQLQIANSAKQSVTFTGKYWMKSAGKNKIARRSSLRISTGSMCFVLSSEEKRKSIEGWIEGVRINRWGLTGEMKEENKKNVLYIKSLINWLSFILNGKLEVWIHEGKKFLKDHKKGDYKRHVFWVTLWKGITKAYLISGITNTPNKDNYTLDQEFRTFFLKGPLFYHWVLLMLHIECITVQNNWCTINPK